ncbi:ABC transporter family protein [Babesia caballi]|uniref:ABC transporter family protein n=1 Tax=Babesia caballi TaxID=5871 RepID=A0AAV4LNU3_BABCB|nr:ABC transporter family protein [Babesia caballi]
MDTSKSSGEPSSPPLGRLSTSETSRAASPRNESAEQVEGPSHDDDGLMNFLFLRWAFFWVDKLKFSFFDLPMLPPLPKADQISQWQPIFSKHVSDGLLRLEKAQAAAALMDAGAKRVKPYRSILLRALTLTFWRRTLLIFVLAVLYNLCNLGVTLLLKFLLDIMAKGDQPATHVILMLCSILFVEVFNSLLEQHLNYYTRRTVILMEGVVSITLFQHGLCHRKDYSSAIDQCNYVSECKAAYHSWDTDSDSCSLNPLMCPARRHKNPEIPPRMYTFLYFDTCNLASIFDACISLVKFLCSFVIGMVIIRTQMGIGVLIPMIVILVITTASVFVELCNGRALKDLLACRDARMSKTSDVVGSLEVLQVSGIDDIGYNVVRDSRRDEMSLLRLRVSLIFINKAMINTIGVVITLIVILDYIAGLKMSSGEGFDLSAPITLLFVVQKITTSLTKIPTTMKILVETYTSFKRLSKFLTGCSPNYYLNSLEKPAECVPSTALTLQDDAIRTLLANDKVLAFEKATFAWIHTREEIINPDEPKLSILHELDFELKRGDVKIVTGAQGCGKTSFIKSILGEMSLVSGSMVVAPLSVGMPIFYTSQEVWLPAADIRSIITFGYAFDEDIYWRVVAAVELLSDFNSWADGDSRVISEKGYSLSGGQRVRLSLARAIYAYLVFSKANESLEENRCCFLMCLDEPFNGLDPTVTKSILNNLFNRKTGLLVRDDVAIVMALSKINLDFIYNWHILGAMVDMDLCNILNGRISSTTRLVQGDERDQPSEPSQRTLISRQLLQRASSLTRMPRDTYRACESGNFMTASSAYMSLRKHASKRDGDDEATEQNKLCYTYPAYFTYLSAVGFTISLLIFASLVSSSGFQKMIAVYIANWCDYIKQVGGCERKNMPNFHTILQAHERTAFIITLLSGLYITCLYAGLLLIAIASLKCSSGLFAYALNSIFCKSSSVVSLKKSIGGVITVFSSDFLQIDERVCQQFCTTLLGLIRIVAQIVTICYTLPVTSPVPIILTFVLLFGVVRRYIFSSKKLECLMLDAMSDINGLYTNAITGSPIYRSYCKEGQCMETIKKQSESFFRCKFLKLGLNIWAILTAKMLACVGTALIFFIPIVCHYLFGMELHIAQVGLGITLTLAFNDILSLVIYNIALMEKHMCSLARYRSFFLQGDASLSEKFESMGETVLSSYTCVVGGSPDEKKLRYSLYWRRKAEYRNFVSRNYLSVVGAMLHRPRIEFLDLSAYLPSDHSTLTLDDVSVIVTSSDNPDGLVYILKGVTASAKAGDIVGIVGRTGAGKTTLMRTLQNITQNRQGSILLDGRDLNTIPRKVLRHLIGVLPQLPFIFKGWTLRRFLDPRMLYSDSDIMTALECCGLLDLVNSLPCEKPLDAIMVEDDVRIKRGLYVIIPLIKLRGGDDKGPVLERRSDERADSPGNRTYFSISQLRMLSFARLVLYRSTYRILLIDEPPSDNCAADHGGDAGSDSAEGSLPVYDLVKIYFKHCTTFIVAHDRRALRTCQHVWYMNNGAIERKVSGEANVAEYLQSFG